jgi:hypothetical protein
MFGWRPFATATELFRVINSLRHCAGCENLHTVYDIQHPVNEHPADFFVHYHTA